MAIELKLKQFLHEIQKLHTTLTQILQNQEDENLASDTQRLEDLPAIKILKFEVFQPMEGTN